MAGVGRYNRFVTLSQSPQVTDDSDGFFEDLSPREAWVYIQPVGSGGERTTSHVVEMRYHPQVTVDTRIVYEDARRPDGKTTRQLFVRSVVDVDDRGDTMRLECEEVAP